MNEKERCLTEKIQKNNLDKYVPKRELVELLKQETRENIDGSLRKMDIIKAIEQKMYPKSKNKIDELIIRYRFAGKTPISWSMSKEPVSYSREEIEKLLKRKGTDPFTTELRPVITLEPQLNKASWLDTEHLFLEFVYYDKEFTYEEDYQPKTIRPQKRTTAIVRLLNSPFVIESRANYRISNTLHEKVAELLKIKSELLRFSNVEIDNLKNQLHAMKKGAKHKMSGGDYDTVMVSVSPTIDDLDDSLQYQQDLQQEKMQDANFQFHASNIATPIDVSIKISSKGSIWFTSIVPEEVVDYLFSCVRQVKGF